MVYAFNLPLMTSLHGPIDQRFESSSANEGIVVSCLFWVCVVKLLFFVFQLSDLLETRCKLLAPILLDGGEIFTEFLRVSMTFLTEHEFAAGH